MWGKFVEQRYHILLMAKCLKSLNGWPDNPAKSSTSRHHRNALDSAGYPDSRTELEFTGVWKLGHELKI